MFEFIRPKITGFGIDLSDLSIKVVNLKKEKDKFSVAGFGRQEIAAGLIENGEIQKEDELIKLVKKVVRETKPQAIATKYCVASLPETESFVRVVQLPPMQPLEVASAIKWEIEANIPLALGEIYYDWQIIPSAGANALLNVLIGVLPKKTIDPYLAVFKKAGLSPIAFEIESVATARALMAQKADAKPMVIIDMGAKRTSILFFYGQAVYFTSSLPISNDSLVQTLSERLQIGLQKAWKIKMKVGLDYERPKEAIYQALETPLLEMTDKIKTYIDFFQEHILPVCKTQDKINDILLCGGGGNMAGLVDFLQARLNLNIRIGNPWINILPDPNQQESWPISAPEYLSYTTALGLALRGQEQDNL